MSPIKKLIAVVAVSGALAAVGTTAAQAYTSDCGSGRICVYDDQNYGAQLGWRNVPFSLQNVTNVNNDRMSSWENHSSQDGGWYTDANGGGTCLNMNAYTVDPYVGLFWNDQMSSWKGTGAC